MEITRLGHSCFKIVGKDQTLLIDPYDESIGRKPVKEKCDILLTTHSHSDHHTIDGVSDYSLHIDGPGEYEKSEVFIHGLLTYHDDSKGAERGSNTVYVIEIDGFTIVHLGDLGHELSQDTLEKIPDVNVLMIPVGGVYTINGSTATNVISSLEPGIVIPMHYQDNKLNLPEKLDGLDKFLDEMGVEENGSKSKLKITTKNDIPADTEVLVLEPTN